MPGIVYESHLKGEYAVENGNDSLIITSSSCYRMKEETLSLIDHLPKEGDRDSYARAMSAMGLEKAESIFDRLLAIDVLRVKRRNTVSKTLLSLLKPDLRLVPAAWQERFFKAAGLSASGGWLRENRKTLFFMAGAGIVLCLGFSCGAIYPTLAKVSSGQPKTLHLLALVLLGSLIHELGHSCAAASAGIGLRPVGFSVYLFYPVFYTNVSGMERLSVGEKAAIDSGGFFAQSAYLFLLLLAWGFTRDLLLLEAMRWISLIMLFNLNPLLKINFILLEVFFEFIGQSNDVGHAISRPVAYLAGGGHLAAKIFGDYLKI